jgi:hypothetical protein
LERAARKRRGQRGTKRAEEREIERGESGASTVLLCGAGGEGPVRRFDARDVRERRRFVERWG